MKFLKNIKIQLKNNSYPIIIGKNVLKNFNTFYSQYCKNSKKILFVSNAQIPTKYIKTIRASMSRTTENYFLTIPSGEKNKNLSEVNKVLEFLTKNNFDRNDTVVALGGGVVGDVIGFAASIFKRGIGFVQVPTTLLAQVDSSVGGKTGVNNSYGKNLIGTFYHPKFVLIDIEVLNSLPKREMISGFAEILKYSLIMNRKFFFWLCDRGHEIINRSNDQAILKAIEISCRSKSIVVGKDEKEKGLRAILNFGHTLGHALESHLKYSSQLNHGEAVIIGMMAASKVSTKLGFLSKAELKKINNLYADLNLNHSIKKYLHLRQLLKFSKIMKKDKKNNSNQINLILLKKIGKALIYKTSLEKTLIPFLRNELINA
jgi:3-dehydroquinate synthase